MKKIISNLVLITFVFSNVFAPVAVSAKEANDNIYQNINHTSESNLSDTKEYFEAVNEDNELLIIFKQNDDYFIKYPNGVIELLASKKLEATFYEENLDKQYPTNTTNSAWRYYKTDQYSTRINWRILDAGISLAEQARILSNLLGIIIGVGSLILSIRPNTVYHRDYGYINKYDPMLWKLNAYVYRYSNYTSLLESYTKQWYINNV